MSPEYSEQEKTMKLKYSGKQYLGDGITAKTGDTVDVSEEKAAQLLADFPIDWKRAESIPEKLQTAVKNKMGKKGKDK